MDCSFHRLFYPAPSMLRVLEQRMECIPLANHKACLAMRRLQFLHSFQPFCSFLRLSVHASTKTSIQFEDSSTPPTQVQPFNKVSQIVLHKTKSSMHTTRLSLLMEGSIVYSKIQVVTHHYQKFSCSQYLLLVQSSSIGSI
ncbi:hypothetical protein H5410_027632 [Solanum commersonii]|uniref:Uncharacterized protein n=1 Tax=Solanum commersonii TaxID=4109 RepID=A0A9J5Z3X7_SOLCO|nr:hypothetical protein H5410_027632 [Solanum commersonii]